MAIEVVEAFMHCSRPDKILALAFSIKTSGHGILQHRVWQSGFLRSATSKHFQQRRLFGGRRRIVSTSSRDSFDGIGFADERKDDDVEFVKWINDDASKFKMEPGEECDPSAAPVFGSMCPSSLSITFEIPTTRLIREAAEDRFTKHKADISFNGFCDSLPIRNLEQKRVRESEEMTDSTYSSVKKAFSSMILIVCELQSHTIQAIFSASNLQFHGILARAQEELQESFIWLFQFIFSATPALMLYLMLLLANFTLFSITDHPADAIFTTQSVSYVIEESQDTLSRLDSSTAKLSSIQNYLEIGSTDSNKETYEEKAWRENGEETNLILASGRHETFMDPNTLRRFVSPFTIELMPDDLAVYTTTELSYRRALAADFDNPLILSNFAQFLYVVLHDYDRAEEYFKRATRAAPADAEALSKYATFLWVARKDLGAAEEAFLEAIEADSSNSYHSANYAHFLWSTGGEDTCYPLKDCSS